MLDFDTVSPTQSAHFFKNWFPFFPDASIEDLKMCESESKLKIRTATIGDAEKILEIYAPYVEKTAVTFEYRIPTAEEFRKRIERTLARYPYLVAELGGKVAGYAYTGALKERAAYDWAVETSVYVGEGMRKSGIGSALYEKIEEISKIQRVQNLNACIAYTDDNDEHLTDASVRFHEKVGFTRSGIFHRCGFKFGRWYDILWMEKMIGGHPTPPEKFIPFSEICEFISSSF